MLNETLGVPFLAPLDTNECAISVRSNLASRSQDEWFARVTSPDLLAAQERPRAFALSQIDQGVRRLRPEISGRPSMGRGRC